MKVMNPRLVRAAQRLDFVWKLASRLAWLAPAGRYPPAERRTPAARSLLVIDLHLVGDMVMLLPLLAALRARHPAWHITLLAGPWSADMLAGTHHVDEVIHYVAPWVKPQPRWPAITGYLRTARLLRKRQWDIGIDVRGDIRQILLLALAGCRRRVGFDFTGGSALLTDVVPDDGSLQHILDHHQRLAAVLDATALQPFVPQLRLAPQEQLQAATIEPFIGFHFGASLPLRRLPPADAAALVALHASAAQPLVLFWAPDIDAYLAEVRALLPEPIARRVEVWRGDLRGFVVKASRAVRIFAMDSGPAHIVAALGRDTVVFFGPNLPRYTAPRSQHVQVVENQTVPCRPCDQRHCINPVRQACMLGLVDAWRMATAAGVPVDSPSSTECAP